MTTLTPVLTEELGPGRLLHPARATSATAATGRCARRSAWSPDEVIQAVKDSGLRGRGGAGFPTGMKWGFLPQGDGKPHYLVVNADESEPGTCKDIPLMMANPHVLVEGSIISSYAIEPNHAFIYVRGEVLHVIRRLHAGGRGGVRGRVPRQGHPRLRLRPGHRRPRRRRRLHLRRGDGAAGLAGGVPRPAPAKPPFPAVAGLYGGPTVINNVESIASVPSIVDERRRVVRLDGHREVPGLRDLLAVRARDAARPVRGAARDHAARAARHGRRHPRRGTG